MKTQMLSFAIIALLSTNLTVAQDISPGQVPSVVLNKFTREYRKARDVEWEKEATTYKVEFELGWNTDHEIRYNSNGEITMHSHDISKKDLPEAVLQTLNTEFSDYRVDDVKRIASSKEVVFSMELNALLKNDLKVVIDQNGKVVSQLQD
ncbi:MAG: PepSY-like domain-containing protein [Lentimicrobiaceae bacterium]|nr:PepSY-like domain-containing protein [Lentimicrobiaceae bacterium]